RQFDADGRCFAQSRRRQEANSRRGAPLWDAPTGRRGCRSTGGREEIEETVAPRVLVCIEDTGVSHVVAARLMKDGVDGVVVDKPGRLVDEAKKGVSALAVQDRYPSGEAATSLLRQ